MSFTLLVEQDLAIEVSRINNPTQTYNTSGNTFSVALGTRNFVDGYQRDIVSVRWGPVELAKCSTYQACNAADGTFFWWPGGSNTLYVNLAGATNPNTGILLARFKMYWSNYPVEYGGRFYDPRLLLSPEDVAIRRAVDSETMKVQPIVAGKFTLANGDGFVDSLLGDYIVEGQKIEKASLEGGVKSIEAAGKLGMIERTDSAVMFTIWN